jgi:hypothetical protein
MHECMDAWKINHKSQYPMTKITKKNALARQRAADKFWDLVLGTCDFLVIWCFGFGIFYS